MSQCVVYFHIHIVNLIHYVANSQNNLKYRVVVTVFIMKNYDFFLNNKRLDLGM